MGTTGGGTFPNIIAKYRFKNVVRNFTLALMVHSTERKPFRFLYQDESGDVGRGQPHFIVGLLMVREREPLWEAVGRVRDRWHFGNELHFEKMSNLRLKVYESVLAAIAGEQAHFRYGALVVPQDSVGLGILSGQRHLAYNYFTKLLLERH